MRSFSWKSIPSLAAAWAGRDGAGNLGRMRCSCLADRGKLQDLYFLVGLAGRAG
jgi:hypothetical protein